MRMGVSEAEIMQQLIDGVFTAIQAEEMLAADPSMRPMDAAKACLSFSKACAAPST